MYPPTAPNFSQFHAVFRKNWQNHIYVLGNPGSAPVFPDLFRLSLKGKIRGHLATSQRVMLTSCHTFFLQFH